MATIMRDARNQPAGIGLKISSLSESTDLLRGKATIDSIWYIYTPQHGSMFIQQTENYLPFVQEVRRFYPFFPLTAARVRKYFEWQGHAFPQGRRVLLDLYGTNHDRRIWKEPERFEPERFLEHNVSPFDFIPQGGGDVRSGHRCPGEDVAVNLMQRTAEFLTHEVQYEVLEQNLEIDFSRMPALPESRFRISTFQEKETPGTPHLTGEGRGVRI